MLNTWLGIKNDYRTLIGVDELSLVDGKTTEGEDGGTKNIWHDSRLLIIQSNAHANYAKHEQKALQQKNKTIPPKEPSAESTLVEFPEQPSPKTKLVDINA